MVDENGFAFDFNRIKRKELKALLKQAESAQADGALNQDEVLLPIVVKVITAWPHPGDPTDPAQWDELGLEDSVKGFQAFWNSFRSLTQAK